MSVTLEKLRQIVADAKNDLHVVEQELAKLVDEAEREATVPPVYENFLPVGTYLLSEDEHRMAPIGTLIAEKDLRNGQIMEPGRWEKVGPNRWRTHNVKYPLTYTDAEIVDPGPDYVNVVVEQELTKLPVGTKLVTREDHEKAPIGTLIREYGLDSKVFSTWSWRKIGQDEWDEYDPSGSSQGSISTARVTQVSPHIVNTVVDS